MCLGYAVGFLGLGLEHLRARTEMFVREKKGQERTPDFQSPVDIARFEVPPQGMEAGFRGVCYV